MLHQKAGKLVWSKIGKNAYDLTCGSPDQYGFTHCGSELAGVTFNAKRMRYMTVLFAGYVTNEPDGADTPNIEIGTCTAL